MVEKTKDIKDKPFAQQVREFFGMGVKKPIDVGKQDPEKTVQDLQKAGGKVPRVSMEKKKKKRK